ncbi:hypothetical protein BDZ89DRAFT_231412 [Hymenopellis radicata]|nr:hypothetical protein BDZ89DRAFT_231412 [Hymenopellis radicata]
MFSGRSSGSTSLPQSPLRMESSLSPSVDQALQTRGPNATAHGVQPPRHSPLPPSSPRSASLSTLDEHSTSQSGSSSSGSFASSHSSPSSLRANAPSSTFSSSSGSTESQTSPKAFVFPSSRSRAHPNLTASGKVPKLKLKSKKNKGKEAQRTSSPSTTSGSSGVTVHNLHPPTSSPEPAVRPRNSSVNSTSPTRRTSSDISSGFVFPSSRSRAHPSGPPSKLRLPLTKKKSKSSSTGSSSAAQVALSEGEPSRSRFMGIPINKKKKLADPVFHTSVDFGGADAYSPMRRSFDDVSLIGSGFGPYEESIRSSWTPTPFATKRDVYPLDPYDGILVEQDRLTTSLLRRLNSCDSPSFHHYGTNPPVSVLDLGCGQGDWVLDAAATWKGYGTRVTGFDMVDITRSLRSAAVKHGVLDSIQFVRGNFLQEALPFPDESFDLVRMASLTYAISFEKWEFVLKEACRVLTVGGRLEMIDDHIFFPYGRAPQAPHPYDTIPEEGEVDPSDSPILSGTRRSGRHPTPSTSTSVVPVDFEADQWTDQAGAARELESLFEHMHNMKFGIHLCPTQFIVDMMEQVLGHANEIRTMHLTLAPPHPGFEATGKEGHSAAPTDEGTHPLLNAPGLMLWPSTFVPMTGPEIEVHALKHPRVLLSLKNSLAEYALEIADEEEVDEAAVKESLWEYEGFLRERLTHRNSYILLRH